METESPMSNYNEIHWSILHYRQLFAEYCIRTWPTLRTDLKTDKIQEIRRFKLFEKKTHLTEGAIPRKFWKCFSFWFIILEWISFLFAQITVSLFPMPCLDTLFWEFVTHDALFFAFQGNFIIALLRFVFFIIWSNCGLQVLLNWPYVYVARIGLQYKTLYFGQNDLLIQNAMKSWSLSYCFRMYFCTDSQFTFGPTISACFLFKWVLKVVLCVAEYALHNRQK